MVIEKKRCGRAERTDHPSEGLWQTGDGWVTMAQRSRGDSGETRRRAGAAGADMKISKRDRGIEGCGGENVTLPALRPTLFAV